jgi:hypothetical protein
MAAGAYARGGHIKSVMLRPLGGLAVLARCRREEVRVPQIRGTVDVHLGSGCW